MSFSTSVKLGTVGDSILNVKLQSCNIDCSNCIDLVGYTSVAVSSFPTSGITTTTSAGTTFINCNGQVDTVEVGGASGFDSRRFCTSDFNSILTSGNVTSLTYIGDCMI